MNCINCLLDLLAILVLIDDLLLQCSIAVENRCEVFVTLVFFTAGLIVYKGKMRYVAERSKHFYRVV